MAKPDDRSDNVEKLQNLIQATEENYRETEEYLNQHGDEIDAKEAENLRAKNARRLQSIEGFREEIRDEAHDH
jgi:small acid-soluble spore protein (thioredoxin-like protein)